ncbi:MAG TPA: N-acetylmuramoyl-L-alanine amidase CwlD [Clostridiaceae bacterium]|jgi:N-acetylmuramoyl-L-alanine amidase cwlD|nr:N-acetylmuramoyl-L-alanine amidase CwlD [Clostridium sp.]MEE0126757.1 N-acetylmuramoyl-L-alanine amidase CwlD [Clostridia bacterium]HJJ12099.1 N-acetylmuramoyl-L-alanine amidase CwlD [Clostridiaceae bacterium]
MFFLSKKRIVLLASLLIAVVSIGIFQMNLKEESIETVALPVSNKVIVLDAGHGNPDGGAVSTNGISEAEINLKIALKLQNLLEQSGATVILTRSDENGIYDADKTKLKNQKVSDIKNRVKIGNSSSADIFVSIHLNKIPQSQYSGWQTFFKSGSEQGEKLATSIQENLNKTIEKENNRVPMKLDNVYIVKNVEIPLTIVECGFLSNEEEERKLQEDDYQDKLAWGIYNGIINYFYE